MSYEGYTQKLCEGGHQSCIDVYCDDEARACECGLPWVWANRVDCTNDGGERDHVELELIDPGTKARYRLPDATKGKL